MSSSFIEVSIKIKDETHTLTFKEPWYGDLLLCRENAFLREKIEEGLKKFGYDPNLESPAIKVKASMNWQP